jgi:methionyl-tRNA formyltransferase
VRTVFLGNDPWSVPPLRALSSSSHGVQLVVTRGPRPAGRGRTPRPTEVALAARDLGLRLGEVDTVKGGAGLEAIREAAPDVLVVVAYGEILPREVLEIPRVAPVNLHFSLLPALRGADPVRRALLEGRTATGVTTIRMDEGMDTGPILLQREEPIRDDDDAGTVGDRLAVTGGDLLVRTLDLLERGEVEERPQDESEATLAPKIRPEEEWIDWNEDAEHVVLQVRALSPEPGARTRFRDKVLKVLRAHVVERAGAPCTVAEVTPERLVVAAGGGSVSLDEVVPEGRKRMTGAEFARGQRPEPGEHVG